MIKVSPALPEVFEVNLLIIPSKVLVSLRVAASTWSKFIKVPSAVELVAASNEATLTLLSILEEGLADATAVAVAVVCSTFGAA